jgi:phage FluMu gp28-like protein
MPQPAAAPKIKSHELPAPLAALAEGARDVASKAKVLLLAYQAYALSLFEQYNFVVIEKSRRIGLTWAVAFYAVWKASRANKNRDFLYISYSQEMTREFIDNCAMWARAIMGAAAEVGEFMFDDQVKNPITGEPDTKQIKAFRIKFASGKEIVALSSAPRSLRGQKGNVCIDEGAFVDNLAALLKAALALKMWGGKVIVLSTHDGVDNAFNQLIEDIKAKRRNGFTHRITFDDALADGLYERICLVEGIEPTPEGKEAWIAEQRGDYGEDAEEELDCIPKAGAGCFIPPELVVANEDESCGKPELYQGGGCFGGRDIAAGRGGDNAAMHVGEVIGNVIYLRDRQKGNNIGLLEQEAIFNAQFKTFRIMRYGVDQTGMGEGEVARAQQKFGSVVQGFILSPAVRLAAATALKRRLEEGTLKLPPDPKLRADLRAIKKTKGTGNVVRLVNEGEVHADEFWALALMCLAAEGAVLVYDGYRAAPAARGKFDEGVGHDGRRQFHMRPEDEDFDRSSRRGGRGNW